MSLGAPRKAPPCPDELRREIRNVSRNLSTDRRDRLLALRAREKKKHVYSGPDLKKSNIRSKSSDASTDSTATDIYEIQEFPFLQHAIATGAVCSRPPSKLSSSHSNLSKSKLSKLSKMSGYSLGSIRSDFPRNVELCIDDAARTGFSQIVEYQKYLLEERTQMDKLQDASNQKKLKSILDKQVREVEQRKMNEQRLAAEHHEKILEDQRLWKEEEEEEKRQHEKFLQSRKLDREYQLKSEEKKKKVKEQKKWEECEEMKWCVQQSENWEEQQKKKKEYKKNMIKQATIEDRDQLIVRKKQKQESEISRDKEFLEAFDKKQDAIEQRRKEEIDKRFRKLGQKEKRILEIAHLNEVTISKGIDMADMPIKEFPSNQNEMKMRETRDKFTKDTQQYLIDKIQERKTKKTEESETTKKMMGEKLKEEYQESLRKEKEKEEKRRERYLSYKDELSEQIEKRRNMENAEMDGREININRELLLKAQYAIKE